MNRRNFIAYLAATSICATCKSVFAQWPGQGNNDANNSGWPSSGGNTPVPENDGNESDSSGLNLLGCTLTGSFNSGRHGFRFLPSSQNYQIDQAIFQEANILAQVTGLQPSLAFLDDRNAPNAFASSQDIINGQSPFGAVALGVSIIGQMVGQTNEITSVGAVLVHEWAHIAQFATGVQSRSNTVAPTELMADFIAGWYHGFRCAHACQNADPRFAETGLASVGDYNTQSKNHHGTPEQRAQAYRNGYQFVLGGGGGGIYGFQSFSGQSFNAYGNGFGGGGGFRRPAQFAEAFNFARRKYVG